MSRTARYPDVTPHEMTAILTLLAGCIMGVPSLALASSEALTISAEESARAQIIEAQRQIAQTPTVPPGAAATPEGRTRLLEESVQSREQAKARRDKLIREREARRRAAGLPQIQGVTRSPEVQGPPLPGHGKGPRTIEEGAPSLQDIVREGLGPRQPAAPPAPTAPPAPPAGHGAAPPAPPAATAALFPRQVLTLTQGKSIIVDVPVRIKRASLADPEVADAIVLSPKQIYVTGKGYGATNLTLWGTDDQVFDIFDLQVGLDLDRLREQFAKLLPVEQNFEVTVIDDHVTLSGSVSTTGSLNQALAIAEVFAPKKVMNFLRVYPEPVEPKDIQPVAVEIIRGTKIDSVKFNCC